MTDSKCLCAISNVGIVLFLIFATLILSNFWNRNPSSSSSPFTEEQQLVLDKIKVQAKLAGLEGVELENIDKFDKELCYDLECLGSALEIMSATNFSVDPCHPESWIDFACQRRLQGTEETHSQLTQLQLDAQDKLKALLKPEEAKNSNEPTEFLLDEARIYYKQCVSRGLQDSRNIRDILNFAAELYGEWPLFTNDTPSRNSFSWMELVAHQNTLQRVGFTPLFFHVGLDSRTAGIRLSTGSLGAESECPLLTLHNLMDLRRLMYRMVRWGKLEEPADMEQLSAVIFWLDETRRKLLQTEEVGSLLLKEGGVEVISLEQLQQHTDEYFSQSRKEIRVDWKQFFEKVFVGTGISFGEEGGLSPNISLSGGLSRILTTIEYVEEQLEEAEGRRNVVNALQLNLVLMLLQETTSLTDDLRMFRREERRPSTCLERTKQLFGYALGKAYLNRHYRSGSLEPKVRTLMDTIKQGYFQLIQSWTWSSSSNSTKLTQLLQKVNSTGLRLVQPEWMKEEGKLEEFFQGLLVNKSENSSYVRNYLQANVWQVEKERRWKYEANLALAQDDWNKYAEIATGFHSSWNVYLGESGASYNKLSQDVYVRAGTLQSPMFGAERPGFMNYGGLGTTLGHEVGHSLIRGIKALRGNSSSTENSEYPVELQDYGALVSDTAALYESVPYPVSPRLTMRLNPRDSTIDEDVADVIGLHAAFMGYQRYLKELEVTGRKERVLPGLKSFSPQQLFFIKYSNVWCDNPDVQSKLNQISDDTHSPDMRRADLPLRLSQQFKSSFSCGL